MEILYHDKELAVCVKPAGVSSQDAGKETDLPAQLRRALGCEDVFPVHRLDTDAAGLMVLALTRGAAAALSRGIAEGGFRKEYLCAVSGVPEPPAGEWEDLLFHDRQKNKTYVVRRERRGVRRAKLAYRVLGTAETENGPAAVVRVRLFTGRTHQIRVQFAARRHPLLGDGKYGSADRRRPLALYSCLLSFRHPTTGEEMTFEKDADFFQNFCEKTLTNGME